MTVFLTGDNFQRNLTAKDANRMLKAAREVDAGAGNLTSRQLQQVWENGHVLVRIDNTDRMNVFSTVGLGPALDSYGRSQGFVKNQQRLNLWPTQKLDVKKHWFRHGVIQQSARFGEIVPCAISGLTLAIPNSQILDTATKPWLGTKIAFDSEEYLADTQTRMEWGPWTYKSINGTISFGGQPQLGQAELLSQSDSMNPAKGRILIKLNSHSTVWRAILTERHDQYEFTGYITAYGQTYAEIKIYDPLAIMPDTTDLPTGTISVIVGIEITQPLLSGSAAGEIPHIIGHIITVERDTMLLGIQTSEEPI